jgi:hypothetical protein
MVIMAITITRLSIITIFNFHLAIIYKKLTVKLGYNEQLGIFVRYNQGLL